MEAERLPDGRTRLRLSRVEFSQSIGLLSEAREWLSRKRDEFPARVGVTFEEAQSLRDELVIARDRLLAIPPRINPHTGEIWSTTEVRKAGTAWDRLPELETEMLPDGRLALTSARGELAIIANSAEVALQETAYMGPKGRDSEMHSRIGMRSPEVEAFRDELRQLDRQVRDDTPRGPSEG